MGRSEGQGFWALFKVTLLAYRARGPIISTVVLPSFLMLLAVMLGGLLAGDPGSNNINGYAIVMYPSLAFMVALAGFAIELVAQKEKKVKYGSLCQGLTLRAYWGALMLAHYLLLLPAVLVFLVGFIVIRPAAISPGAMFLPLLMLFVLPATSLLITYIISSFFSSKEIAAKVITVLSSTLGLLPPMSVWALMKMAATHRLATVLHFVFSALIPTYGLSGSIVMLNTKYAFHYPSGFSWKETGWEPADGELTAGKALTTEAAVPLYFAPIHLALLAFVLIRLERRGAGRSGKPEVGDLTRKDEDVLAEERRIAEATVGSDAPGEAAVYKGLFHTYRTRTSWLPPKCKETPAVRGISLGIRSGECFGLLGPNGAGKTTTLAVLTGEVHPPTDGRVFVAGHDLGTFKGLTAAQRQLGICPQVDPLWENISGRDHIIYYARLKGIPEADVGETADLLLKRLGLEPKDGVRKAGTYSGGMKRKLSVGIALIGRSSVLFLDEPSAAVDAGAKRHLWEVIRKRRQDQTVVLTTHSMEEAEALCDRLAVQVRGQLRCLGSVMHIKERYSSGYQLELFTKPGAPEAGVAEVETPGSTSGSSPPDAGQADSVEVFVRQQVTTEAKLLEQVGGRYVFQLPAPGEPGAVALGHIFRTLETNKASFGFDDFSVTQPSLEQVFLRFAKEQHDADLQEQRQA